MRFTSVSFILVAIAATALAGPVAKVTEKKSLIGDQKLEKEAPKIEEIGDQKDRSKKSTTTFCVEIRPGTNEAVQKSCACKDKEGHSDGQQAPQLVPQSAPQQLAPQQQAPQQQAPQLAPASAPPSVNIIHAPPQQPQTLNIIQPAPTLHALHFVQPQSGPSAVQNLHFLQPAAQLPEPRPQTHHYAPPSKPAIEESLPSKPVHAEIIVKPSEPAPKPAIQPEAHLVPQPAVQPAVQPASQPAPQSQHTEQSHKSEVHVSVVTADKKEDETKPHFENIVQPAPRPVETIKLVPVAPMPRPFEEQIVVVPNTMMTMHQPEPCQHSGAIIQVPQMSPGSLYQPQGALYQPQGALYQPQGAIYPQGSVYQMPSSMYQQGGGPVYTECSCKQMHPASSNVHSMIVPSQVKAQGRHAKITPLVIYPPAAPSMPVQSEKSAVSVHCNNPESTSAVSSHSNDSPVIVNMQTARSKDGSEQGEAEDMTQSNMSERTVSHISLDTPSSYYHGHIHHAPKVYYDATPGIQANLYKEPLVKPYYGGHHQVHMEISRQAQPSLDGSKQEENKDKLDSMLVPGTRITRSDKEATTKVEDKAVEEKKVEEKTSSAKAT